MLGMEKKVCISGTLCCVFLIKSLTCKAPGHGEEGVRLRHPRKENCCVFLIKSLRCNKPGHGEEGVHLRQPLLRVCDHLLLRVSDQVPWL